MLRSLLDWQYEDDATWRGRIHAARQAALAAPSHPVAAGRHAGLLFFNPSLRTRTSMEVALSRLGAGSSTIVPGQGTWGFEWEQGRVMDGDRAEHITEAAGVLSAYFDAIGIRLFASMTDRAADQADMLLHQFASAATVPVINLESASYHPCQALADAATIDEQFDGEVKGRRFVLAWAYHPRPLPRAVPNSALLMAARQGMEVTVAAPPGFEPDEAVLGKARAYGPVSVSHDLDAAVDGAHVVYAKAWSGRAIYEDPEQEARERLAHRDWRITEPRMRSTQDGVFMHCLPVRRNVVVDDAVIDGAQAIHLRQAAYRLYAQQAILSWLWDLPDATP